MREPVSTAAAPRPGWHYSQAQTAGRLLFVSGQLPIRPDGEVLAHAPSAEQAWQAVANLLAIVQAAGAEPRAVVRTTAYLVGVERWAELDTAYAAAFGDHRPARSVVPVPGLHHGCLVEIEGIAER